MAVTAVAGRPAIRRLTLAEAVGPYRERWQGLVAPPECELFLGPEWVHSSAAAHGIVADMNVLVAEDPTGNPIWLSPLRKKRLRMLGVECSVLETPGTTAYHNALLTRESAASSLASLAEQLSSEADIVLFPEVVEGGVLDQAIKEFQARRNWPGMSYRSVSSPYVVIGCSWQEFLQSKSSNFRYSLGRKERALKKKGKFEERWFTSESDVPAFLDAMLAVEGESWKVAADMAISADSVEREYYRRLLPFLASSNALAANAIYLDHAPIAYSLCYKWGGKYGQLKTSFSERYSGLSPGLVINERSVRRAFEEGCTEFDFLGDVMPHKMHWTKDVRVHNHVYLFAPSLKMRFVGGAKRLMHALRRQRQVETEGRGAHRRAGGASDDTE
jgi:CelD/BcsL family acetyltransferase involved in cellulose biosynthesis